MVKNYNKVCKSDKRVDKDAFGVSNEYSVGDVGAQGEIIWINMLWRPVENVGVLWSRRVFRILWIFELRLSLFLRRQPKINCQKSYWDKFSANIWTSLELDSFYTLGAKY